MTFVRKKSISRREYKIEVFIFATGGADQIGAEGNVCLLVEFHQGTAKTTKLWPGVIEIIILIFLTEEIL